jgi:ribonuclease Z
MKVIFLGTAASKPTKERGLSSVALQYQGEVILFDCGENAQRQMISLIKPSRISAIFLSHFHGDHVLGVPGLLMTMSLNQREDPLEIFGPEKTIYFLKNLLNSGYFGITFEVRVKELEENEKVDFKDFYVQCFKTDHGIPSLGYIFKEKDRRGSFIEEKAKKLGIKGKIFSELEKNGEIILNGEKISLEDVTGSKKRGRSVIYTGDTLPVDIPWEHCDLLIHDSTFLTEEDRNETYHTTVREACDAAVRAEAKTLVLTHISQRYSVDEILEEARKYCENTVVAEDLMVIDL